ncbi:MAG: hypothetical protein QM771_11550 [Nitrospira sp.]
MVMCIIRTRCNEITRYPSAWHIRTDLPIASLRQDDPESARPQSRHEAWARSLAYYDHTFGHVREKGVPELTIHFDAVLALVPVLNPQDLVDDIAIIGQKDETRRILVEPSDGKNALLMVDFRDDVPGHVQFRRRRHPDRLMIFDIDRTIAPLQDRSVTRDNILRGNLITKLGHHPVNRDPAFGNQPVCLAA